MTGRLKKMNIIAIGSHPDDIEFGCGGALIKYVDKGCDVFLLVMSRGEMGGGPDVREKEQEGSAKVLGASDLFWGGLVDTRIDISQDNIQRLEKVIKKINPDIIFCHNPYDTHQDHRHLAQMTISATRNIRNVLFYEGPTTERFDPQVYVDISNILDRKISALKAHQSQIERTNIEGVSIIEMARSCANFRGFQGRVKYAEAFCALRLFINL